MMHTCEFSQVREEILYFMSPIFSSLIVNEMALDHLLQSNVTSYVSTSIVKIVLCTSDVIIDIDLEY